MARTCASPPSQLYSPAAKAALAGGGSASTPAPGETTGVETGAPLSQKECESIAAHIQTLRATSQKKWERCMRTSSFDEVLTPLSCYKFVDSSVDMSTDPRRKAGR